MCDKTLYELNTELANSGAKLKLTPEGVVSAADLTLFVNAMIGAATEDTVNDSLLDVSPYAGYASSIKFWCPSIPSRQLEGALVMT